MTWWTAAWVFWFAFFGLVEGAALLNKTPSDTLSEHVWKWLRVFDARPTKLVIAARVVLALFLVWLCLHLTLGWLTPTRPIPWHHYP